MVEVVDCGAYIAYRDGRIYCKVRGSFLKGYINNGYYEVHPYINGVRVRRKMHRLICEAFHENPNNLPMVNHINGIKTDNRADNVEWCDAYHNNKHARDTGLNNISKANSDRWKDPEWASKTAANISAGRIGLYGGRKNPRFKYEIVVGDTVYLVKEFFELHKDNGMPKFDTGLIARVKAYMEHGKYKDFFDRYGAVPRLAKRD